MPELTLDPKTHTYRLDGVEIPGVNKILEALGIKDTRWYTEEACARGKAVHDAIQYLVEDDLDEASVAPEIAPYVDAFRLFLKESGFQVQEAEIRLSSRPVSYAGTADLIGRFELGPCLVEIKTGSTPPWAKLQAAAYALCFTVPPQRFLLELRKNGTYRLRECSDPDDYGIWLACLRVYGLLRDYGRLNGGNDGSSNGGNSGSRNK